MSSEITRVFDAMAGSYDELEPWYEHLYAVLHAIVRREFGPAAHGPAGTVATTAPRRPSVATERDGGAEHSVGRPRALDVGCGTGYQTALLEALGYETHGLDLAAGLLAEAQKRVPDAALVRADASALPYPDASLDAVACCGSTLSLVEDPARVLQEIGRVLRPGGRALVECEHKWSLDLGWMLLSALTGDPLGYGVCRSTLLEQLRRPLGAGIDLDYPLPVTAGVTSRVPLHLFTHAELDRLLGAAGLQGVQAWGIHALTNLIPSTVLHGDRLGRATGALYGALGRLDDGLRRLGIADRFANSLVILAVRPSEPRYPHRDGRGSSSTLDHWLRGHRGGRSASALG